MVNQEGEGSYDQFVLGLHEYESANALTQMHIDRHLSEFVFITEAALNMRQDGFFSDGTWTGIQGGVLALLRTPGGAQWWKYGRQFIGSEIVAFIDEELPKVDLKTPNFLDFTPAYRNRFRELSQQ